MRGWTAGLVSILVMLSSMGLTGCYGAGREEAPPPPAKPASMAPSANAMAIPTGDRSTSVVYLEKSGPKEVVVGQEFEYQIRVTNLTKAALSQVKVTDTLPEGMQAKSATPQGKTSGNKVMWDVGTLAAGATKTLTARAVASKSGDLTNCASVTYAPPEVCLTVKATQPALKVSLAGPNECLLCDSQKWKVVVTNAGTGMARRAQVKIDLPQGLTTLDGKSEVMVNAGDLESGKSYQTELQTKAAKTGSYAVKAAATAEGGLTAQSETVTTMIRTPVLVIQKDGPSMRNVGRPITYKITVSNTGDATAANVMLTDVVDAAAATFNSATDGGTMSGSTVKWNLGNIEPDKSRTVSYTITPTKLGEVQTTSTATAYCGRATGQTVTMVQGIPAILLEAVDTADPIELGKEETYVITVTNQGSAPDTNIVVECTLPEELQYVSSTGPTKAAVSDQVVKFAPLGSLAAKDKAVYKVVAKSVGTGDARFRVKLTTGQLTSPVEETESTNIAQ